MAHLIQAINPIAIEIGPLSIAWYGIIIAIGIFIGLTMASREAERLGFHEDYIVDMAIWVIPIGFIGARLYYVLFELDYYLQHPAEIIAIWQGGIAIYGGLIAGGLTLIWYCRHNKMPIWLSLDILAPSVMLAQAIGRWGNFVNQEAHGGPVNREFLEGLHLPSAIIEQMNINGTYYHPTFLYESSWNIIGLIVILILRRQDGWLKRGEVALIYISWYSFGRFFIEGMRTDSLYFFNTPIRVSQVLSAFLFIGAIAIMVYRRMNTYPPLPAYQEGLKPEEKRNIQ